MKDCFSIPPTITSGFTIVPGDNGPMHWHTADQAFYGLQGECYINFPDGTRQSITPGVLVVIPKGQYYQQEPQATLAMFFLRRQPGRNVCYSRFGTEG